MKGRKEKSLFTIRKAVEKDARRISYLIKKNTERVGENNYTPEQIAIWKKANTPKRIEDSLSNRVVFCAFENGRMVGAIGLEGNEVVGLYVSYARRKDGIGKKLLAYLEQYAKGQQLTELKLTSTLSAVKFYTSSGFNIVKSVEVKVMDVVFYETAMGKKI